MRALPLPGTLALTGQLLMILGTLILAGRYPPAALLFTLSFWALLVLYLHHRGVRPADGLPFLPLLPLYYLTFFFHRGAPGTMDYVFGSDTARYFQEALRFLVSPRHIGLGIFSFPLSSLDRMGEALRLGPRLGEEFLYLQSAMVGVTVVVLFSRLIRTGGKWSWLSLLTSYVFAISLAVWTFSSLLESFMPSLLFLLLALDVARDIHRRAGLRDCVALGLVSVLALTMSLENLYLLLLLPVALLVRPGRTALSRAAQLAGAYGAVLAVGFLPLFAAARQAAGPDFYRDWAVGRAESGDATLAGNLGQFVTFHSRIGRLAQPGAYAAGVYRIFVMSIRAQPGRPSMTYMWDLDGISPYSPANLAYGALLLGVVSISCRNAWSSFRSRSGDSSFWLPVLTMLLLLRQIFVTFYAWRASILFSLPSILALWLVVGLWLAPGSSEPRRKADWVGGVCLALLGALLFVSNLGYLLAIARAAPPL